MVVWPGRTVASRLYVYTESFLSLSRRRRVQLNPVHLGKPQRIQVKIATRSAVVIGTPPSCGGIEQSSRCARMSSCQSAMCWYVARGQGPFGVPEWQVPLQRRPIIGEMSANVGAGLGHSVGGSTGSHKYDSPPSRVASVTTAPSPGGIISMSLSVPASAVGSKSVLEVSQPTSKKHDASVAQSAPRNQNVMQRCVAHQQGTGERLRRAATINRIVCTFGTS